MASDWGKIIAHFEATAKCVHKYSPKVEYTPGCLVVETGKCGCAYHDGEGFPLTQVLMEWQKKFGG